MLTEENDVTLASTTETQDQLDHATGPDWRKPFVAPTEEEKTAKAAEAAKAAATKTAPASEPGKAGVKDGESTDETDLPPGAKKRIDTLTAKLRAAERERDALMKRPATDRTPVTAAAPKTDAEPVLKDFKTWDDWNAAHGRWVVRDEQRKAQAEERQAREQESAKEVFDSHLARVTAYRTEHADFDDKVQSLDNFVFEAGGERANIAFQLAITEADNGPAVLEYLADHPDEMAKFAEYSPVRVQLAIGRISAALSPSTAETDTTPKQKPTSRTPAPPTPVRRSTAAPATRLDDPKLSTDDFIRIRNEQERNHRRR